MAKIKRARYIGILGYDTSDISVYLSMVLKNLQYDVIVADISCRARFFFQQVSCDYSYKGIYFYKGDVKGLKEEADFIFVLSDRVQPSLFELCDNVYVVSDNSFGMSEYIKDTIRVSNKLDGVIFRDITDNGVTGRYIVNYIIRDDYLIKLMKKGCIYEIGDDEIDREYKISLGYEGISSFKNLSEGFSRVLVKVIRDLTNLKEHDIEKALNRAKEGKIIEYSILE